MDTSINILVVDDSSVTRKVMLTYLRNLGFDNVQEADDGNKALPMLRETQFGLLITDANMPGMRGLDLLRTVRADPVLSALPVLIVTIESRDHFVAEAVEAGVDAYVVKPFSLATLQSRISKILERPARV